MGIGVCQRSADGRARKNHRSNDWRRTSRRDGALATGGSGNGLRGAANPRGVRGFKELPTHGLRCGLSGTGAERGHAASDAGQGSSHSRRKSRSKARLVPGPGFSTAWVAAKEQEQAVDRVGDAVGDDWSSQATSSPKEQEPQESAIDHVFDHSRNALADVGAAEKYVNEDRANGPSNTRITPNSGKAIHQVAAVDHLFTERSKGPGER